MVNTQEAKAKEVEVIITIEVETGEDNEVVRTQTPQEIPDRLSVIICVARMALTSSSFIYRIR